MTEAVMAKQSERSSNEPDESRNGSTMKLRTRMILFISLLIAFAVMATTGPALYQFSDSLTLVNLKNSQQCVAGLRSELENQKQEAVKGATILALNSDIRKAVASKESSSLLVNITPIAENWNWILLRLRMTGEQFWRGAMTTGAATALPGKPWCKKPCREFPRA